MTTALNCNGCGSAGICQHNRGRSDCKDCGGASNCSINRERSDCKGCGGTSICQHNCIGSTCKCGWGHPSAHTAASGTSARTALTARLSPPLQTRSLETLGCLRLLHASGAMRSMNALIKGEQATLSNKHSYTPAAEVRQGKRAPRQPPRPPLPPRAGAHSARQHRDPVRDCGPVACCVILLLPLIIS